MSKYLDASFAVPLFLSGVGKSHGPSAAVARFVVSLVPVALMLPTGPGSGAVVAVASVVDALTGATGTLVRFLFECVAVELEVVFASWPVPVATVLVVAVTLMSFAKTLAAAGLSDDAFVRTPLLLLLSLSVWLLVALFKSGGLVEFAKLIDWLLWRTL